MKKTLKKEHNEDQPETDDLSFDEIFSIEALTRDIETKFKRKKRPPIKRKKIAGQAVQENSETLLGDMNRKINALLSRTEQPQDFSSIESKAKINLDVESRKDPSLSVEATKLIWFGRVENLKKVYSFLAENKHWIRLKWQKFN